MNQNCVFCKIANGKLNQNPIYENESFFVVHDINPKVKGHLLVIPKEHYETFLDLPQNQYQDFLNAVSKVTKETLKETNSKGYNLIVNNKPVAGQVVPHLHLHILPRNKDDKITFNY